MIGYCITPDGYYTGKTTQATPSPFRAGEYFLPALSVAKPPPVSSAGEIQRWVDEDWVIERVASPEPPPAPPAPARRPTTQQQQAMFLLRLAAEHITAATAEGWVIPADWIAYRDKLTELVADDRDIIQAIPVPPIPISAPSPEPQPAEPSMDDIRRGAVSQISSMLDRAAFALTGVTPFAEQLSWSVKQAAAVAWQAGVATDDHRQMLEAEAAITGETLDELTAVVLSTAASYWPAAGAIAGLRRTLTAAIRACEDIDSINMVLAEAETVIQGINPT